MDQLVYWIWLSLAVTPDSATFPKLLLHFPDAKSVYDADIKEISRAIGTNASDRKALAEKCLDKATQIYDYCRKYKIGIVAYHDERYPASLREIQTPPVLLYYRGVLPDFNSGVYIASVGTRTLSDYGRRTAFKFCYDLATSGATIVSGMAMGIDGVSHAAALSAGARTVAVLGSGIDVCYPSSHLHLAREIVKSGCIMTEFSPKTPPNKYNFPKRNRIISGLCSATLIVEGSEKSGALITARAAQKQGRVVYALPGKVGDKNSEASNLMLKNGARLVTAAEDIIKDYSYTSKGLLNPFNLAKALPVDIMSALAEYKVVAVTVGDNIFTPPRSRVKKSEPAIEESYASAIQAEPIEPPTPPESFDKRALKLYKRIPTSGECSIESLVDEEFSLRDVMKLLLKLEMGKFVIMLRGEKVSRKSN